MSAKQPKNPHSNNREGMTESLPAPTASELIAAVRALQGSEPFPKGLTDEDKEYRELLFREAAELWNFAEGMARTYREKGARAASLDGFVDAIVEAKARANANLSPKERLLFVTGMKNITRARKSMKEYLATLNKPGVDLSEKIKIWETWWMATRRGDRGLLREKENYDRWHKERRSEKNRSNAGKRISGKPRRKKKRLG